MMAVGAGLHGIVELLDDLRETGRPRRQEFVAVEARPSFPGDGRSGCRGIVRVAGGGAVAHLAGKPAVEGPALHLGHLGMAVHASRHSRVHDLLAGRDIESRRTIVPQLAEGSRNEHSPRHDEGGDSDREKDREPDHLVGDLSDLQPASAFPAEGSVRENPRPGHGCRHLVSHTLRGGQPACWRHNSALPLAPGAPGADVPGSVNSP